MKKDIRIFLLDIEECIAKIEEYTGNISKEAFMKDTKLQDAVMRRIEIIGEAGKNIPEDFKNEHQDMPWRGMARMRDKLIHGYFGVNMERVWAVVKDDLPDLKKKIKSLLDKM